MNISCDGFVSFCVWQDFAETTMNELLGWYGYTDKVDQQDTAQLTLTSYRPSSTSPRHPKQRGDDDNQHSEDNANGDDNDNDAEGVDLRGRRSSESGDSEQDTGRLSEFFFFC